MDKGRLKALTLVLDEDLEQEHLAYLRTVLSTTGCVTRGTVLFSFNQDSSYHPHGMEFAMDVHESSCFVRLARSTDSFREFATRMTDKVDPGLVHVAKVDGGLELVRLSSRTTYVRIGKPVYSVTPEDLRTALMTLNMRNDVMES